MIKAFLCLGSNLGNPSEHLAEAVFSLKRMDYLEVTGLSPIFFTEPQGKKNQPWFHNQTVRISCREDMAPDFLLRKLLALESRLGRVRDPLDRFGPRAIDIDLLLFGDCVITSPFLTVPHPRMKERAFVLVPLLTLEPDLVFPDGTHASDCLKKLDYRQDGNYLYQ